MDLDTALLRVVLLAQALVFAALVAAIFGHAVWLRVHHGRAEPRMERGRASLYRAASQGRVTAEDVALLRSLSPRLQVRLFVELASSLGGSHREAFAELAREAGLTPLALALCRRRQWWHRVRGVR
ncbi:MAG TPA: hypothetical protein VFH27_17240, partial [Longimicrobiaceae bacterium]|nr:hypothetical protein [Longimicrobiaceae bacterium]